MEIYQDKESGLFMYQGAEYEDFDDLILTGILGLCGCGFPNSALITLRKLLSHIKIRAGMSYEQCSKFEKSIGDEGAIMLLYYMLDDKDLTDHGGSVPGWLTEKGEMVLAALEQWA